VGALKVSLVKKTDADSTGSEVEDVLKALGKVEMTIELLRSTKVGKSVVNAAKKYGKDTTTGVLADSIVAAWKVVAENAKKSPAATAAPKSGGISAKLESNRLPAKAASADAGAIAGEAAALPGITDDQLDCLSDVRRKILGVFSDRLKAHCVNASIANFLAYTIEGSVNKMRNADFDRPAYTAKARSLAFNLKQNEQLRQDLADGSIPPEALVFFTQAQLATEQQREKLQKGEKDAFLERRSDYFKLARDKLCRDNGIDPEQGGQFRCRKCGGNKTTNYQMQTRSADEPMTVFICCLKCGHRWRE